jgi:ribosomal protein S18 acetylase RimI-like enzyme
MADEKDVDRIVELWEQLAVLHETLEPFYRRCDFASANFRTYVNACLEVPDTQVLVCGEDGEVVGYCIAVIELHPPVYTCRAFGFIDNLVVDESERRKGAGTALVREALDWLKSRGMTRVELNVAEVNEAGIAFWKSQGFADFQRVLARGID